MISATDIYQSRVDREAAIILRQDPVVYSSPDARFEHGLEDGPLAGYRKNGFVVLERLFSAQEAQELLLEVQAMSVDTVLAGRDEVVREPGTRAVRSVFRIHALSRRLRRLAHDVRLVNVARQILGSEVYIHQSRANLKPGLAGKEFYWHSDFETWNVEDGMPRMRAVSCSVLLTENNEFNGPLMLIPGSHMQYVSCVGETPQDHYKQSLKKQEYGVPDPASLRLLADQGGIASAKGPAGSVVFFDCNVMHGSNSNISPYPRSNLFFVYNSVENVLGEPRHGLRPRPEFIATREDCSPIKPLGGRTLKQVE